MPKRIEHTEIQAGDRIILANAPAAIVDVRPFMGYADCKIIRDDGTRGRYYLGAPVYKVAPSLFGVVV